MARVGARMSYHSNCERFQNSGALFNELVSHLAKNSRKNEEKSFMRKEGNQESSGNGDEERRKGYRL